jgi:TRAP-type C4-dicarboxylate transport system permease small subunit
MVVLSHGGHIRVSLLLANASPALRRVLDIAAATVALLFMTFLAHAMVKFTYASYAKGQTSISSDTPLWIPQAIVTFGMVLLALQLLARVIQALLGLPLEDARMKAGALVE